MFRAGLSLVLRSAFADAQVLEAGSLEEAMRCPMNAPDVLLLDVQLPGLSGLDGIALLKRKWPEAPIIMLSADATQKTVQMALERGVKAFISKSEAPDDMLAIISQVMRKEPVSPALAGIGRISAAQSLLTPRQCEVLDLLCRGLSNKMIGRRLGLSENTVRGHVQAVLAALEVSSRSEAAYAARQLGLVG